MTSYTTNGTYPYPDPTDAVTDYPATAATFAGYLDNLPNRNLIINGQFDFWQRGVNPSMNTSGSYGADRWRLDWDGTGGTRQMTCTPGGVTLGTSIGGMQPYRTAQVVITTATTGGSFMRFAQRIEGVRSLAGQTATLSFWTSSTVAPKTMTVRAVQNFGTAGSPSSPVTTTIGTVTTTTSYARKTFTFTVPALTGKTMGANPDDYLEIHFDLGTQTGTFNFWGVQLEQNSTATALERRPLQQELALCQRYYEVGIATGFVNRYSDINTRYYNVSYKVTKRNATSTVTNQATIDALYTAEGFRGYQTGQANTAEPHSAWTSSAEL